LTERCADALQNRIVGALFGHMPPPRRCRPIPNARHRARFGKVWRTRGYTPEELGTALGRVASARIERLRLQTARGPLAVLIRPHRVLPRSPETGARGVGWLSFDDLVGAGEDHRRDSESERSSRLEIDDQFELGRLLDRQIGGFGAFKDPSDVNADLAKD